MMTVAKNVEKASNSNFPYASSSTIYIYRDNNTENMQYERMDTRDIPMFRILDMLKKAKNGEGTVIASWTGHIGAEVVVIDDFNAAMDEIRHQLARKEI